MKRKPWTLCREFLCRRPTWSRKLERDIQLRVCSYHAPWGSARTNQKPKAPPTSAVKGKASPFALPLICAFHSFEVRPNGQVLRSPHICGKPAPRRYAGDRSLPRHPSRFGDPLCEEHRRFARDERAFPDEGAELDAIPSELEEERGAHSDALQAMLHEALDEIARLEEEARAKAKMQSEMQPEAESRR